MGQDVPLVLPSSLEITWKVGRPVAVARVAIDGHHAPLSSSMRIFDRYLASCGERAGDARVEDAPASKTGASPIGKVVARESPTRRRKRILSSSSTPPSSRTSLTLDRSMSPKQALERIGRRGDTFPPETVVSESTGSIQVVVVTPEDSTTTGS